jgi:hypothetical protein
MMHVLRWIDLEVREPSNFYGLNDLDEFLMKFELKVVESHILPILDTYLKVTPSHLWGTHKEIINNWFQFKTLLCIRFDKEKEHRYQEKYDRIGQPKEHVDMCMVQWRLVPLEEWTHHFIHTTHK